MSITRYTEMGCRIGDTEMGEDPNGLWVRYDDIKHLLTPAEPSPPRADQWTQEEIARLQQQYPGARIHGPGCACVLCGGFRRI